MIFERDFTFYILYFVCNVNNGKIVDNVQYIVDFCYLNINNLGYINGKELIESQPYSRNLQIHKMPNIDCLIGLYNSHVKFNRICSLPFDFEHLYAYLEPQLTNSRNAHFSSILPVFYTKKQKQTLTHF